MTGEPAAVLPAIGVGTPLGYGIGAAELVAAARECFRREIGPYLAVPTYRAAAIAVSSEAEVDAAADAWRSGGRAAAAEAVPSSLADELLFVLGAEDPRPRLEALARAGCDRVRFIPLTPEPGDSANAHAVVAALAALR